MGFLCRTTSGKLSGPGPFPNEDTARIGESFDVPDGPISPSSSLVKILRELSTFVGSLLIDSPANLASSNYLLTSSVCFMVKPLSYVTIFEENFPAKIPSNL